MPADEGSGPSHDDFGLRAPGGAPPAAPPPAAAPLYRKRRVGRIVFWVSFAIVIAGIAGMVVGVRGTIRLFTIDSMSMSNTLRPGDQLIADIGSGIRRGDVVLIKDPLGPRVSPGIYVKRLIGLQGDHVACCDAAGDVTVNGKELHEGEYLYPGDKPSQFPFSVTLGKGQAWVMGDHRIISLDSRAWGPVPEANILGRESIIKHGSSYLQATTPGTFVQDGLAPSSGRIPAFYYYFGGFVLGVLVLLALSVLGVTRWAIRRSRVRRTRRVG